LGCPDALPGFLEVVHRLFEDGVFVGHGLSIWTSDTFRSPDYFASFAGRPSTNARGKRSGPDESLA
jgi:hypothetical protein